MDQELRAEIISEARGFRLRIEECRGNRVLRVRRPQPDVLYDTIEAATAVQTIIAVNLRRVLEAQGVEINGDGANTTEE